MMRLAQLAQQPDPAAAVVRGYEIVINRKPRAGELQSIAAFIKAQEESYQSSGKKNARALALADLAQVLFGLNEFIYVR